MITVRHFMQNQGKLQKTGLPPRHPVFVPVIKDQEIPPTTGLPPSHLDFVPLQQTQETPQTAGLPSSHFDFFPLKQTQETPQTAGLPPSHFVFVPLKQNQGTPQKVGLPPLHPVFIPRIKSQKISLVPEVINGNAKAETDEKNPIVLPKATDLPFFKPLGSSINTTEKTYVPEGASRSF